MSEGSFLKYVDFTNSDLSFHVIPYHALPQYQPQQFNRCGSLV